MTRRSLLVNTMGFGLAAAAGQDSPEAPAARPRPAWVKEAGIVMAGNWEPLTFLRRRGGASVEELDSWAAERTEEAARRLREAGVNLVVTSFFKGFGLKTEAPDIEATRRFVGYAHRHGIRVGGYIGGSLMYETLFEEEPGSADWKQIDELGHPIYYVNPAQSFRYMACRNNPGYHAFLLRLMRIGVQELKLDLIHIDQMESWAEPDVCRCRHCRAAFRAFLRDRYSEAELRRRFGFARLDAVVPPPFERFIAAGVPEITNPLMQDWVRFRSAAYARRLGEYDAWLGQLNREVALECNPNLDGAVPKGVSNSVDPERLLAHGDIVWSEEPQEAAWTSDGRLVSKIRSFKMARRMGKSLFVYTGSSYQNSSGGSPTHLKIAEAMAFNDLNLGMVGDVSPDGVALTPEARRYIRFFETHKSLLRGTVSIAEVAVLRSFASIEFNPAQALVSTVLFEQSLIQARIPFDIIFDRHLDELDRYRVLVLAGQDALGDGQLQAIRRFVLRGGGLVATGRTSLVTESRLKRRVFGLADLLGRDQPPAGAGTHAPSRLEHGPGRAVYVPGVLPAVEPPPACLNYRFDNAFWKLPRNHDELIAEVTWAARGDFPVTVDAPAPVAMELARQAASGRILLHLVNYDFRHPATDITVTLRLPPGAACDEIALESPDAPGRQTLAGVERDGRVTIRVPQLVVYGLLAITFRKL